MTKHIPILFSTAMVQAILEGRKTQTRRVVKGVNDHYYQSLVNHATGRHTFVLNGNYNPSEKDVLHIKCRYGQAGDVLWVRETWCDPEDNHGNSPGNLYKADFGPEPVDWIWKPSIHMPKEACRIFLKVISIRVERLQDISEQDAIAEGVKLHHRGKHYLNYEDEHYKVTQFIYNLDTAVESYKSLWRLINGRDSWNKSSWDNNPWVWVVEFELTEKPENFNVNQKEG